MSDQQRTEDQEKAKDAVQRRRTAPWLLGGIVLLLLFTLVALQAFGVWTVLPPDTNSDTLLIYALSSLNFAAFVVFAFIFVRSLLKLRRERKERQLGSKIKTRLVVSFISLSLLPITAMALFSYLFFNRTLEKWFYNGQEEVIKGATDVEHKAIANQSRSLRETAQMLATLIEEQGEATQEQTLIRLISSGNLAAIEITSADGHVLTRSQAQLPSNEQAELSRTLETARSGRVDESLTDGKGFDVVSVPLNENRRLIVAPMRLSNSNLGDIITGSQSHYNNLVAKQRKVRLLGLSTLGLMTLLLLFAAAWIAIHLARGIAKPIQALAEASNEIARGNLEHRVTTVADDELALLANSFNQMTAQLAENRRKIEAGAAELRDKNLALEERRNYIETVLESLSTGVISLDENERVTTINASAVEILKLGQVPLAKTELAELVSAEDRAVLERLLRRARRAGKASEQTELGRNSSPDGASLPVALTATALRSSSGEGRGVVLVIEDLSELLSAQRAAAWSEVARRMAHEIKNPLTPIQLSAERIAKNFHRESNGADSNGGSNGGSSRERERVASVVDECTATITREVAGLKAMVDEFSRFARLPHARLESADLNEVVLQAVALYEDRLDDARMDVLLGQRLPPTMLDREQLRRVFVNLLDNALEALAGVDGERRITVATAYDPSRGVVLVEVADTGHGIPRSDFARLFQPNFSTRERGTGLGLAIVQRIVTEHNGSIRVAANHPRGAKFTIELTVTNA
jgi:PAS domain S-box-containing protein